MALPEITLIGNLAGDAEIKTSQAGTQYVKFTVAQSTRRLNQQTSQWEDGDVLWANCTLFDSKNHPYVASLASVLVKGAPVIVTATVRTDKYTAADGTPRSTTSYTVNRVGVDLTRQRTGSNTPIASASSAGFGAAPVSVSASAPSDGFVEPDF